MAEGWAGMTVRQWTEERRNVTKQTSKAQLLNDIVTERRRLEKSLVSLSEEEMVQPGVTGNWSVKDILAHIVAWEQLLLSWHRSGIQGQNVERPPVGMSQRAIDELNQEIYEKHRDRCLEETKAEFSASYRQILAAIEEIPEEDMFVRGRYGWTGKLTLADYIAGNTCNHYAWAKAQIRKWRKRVAG
jgi:hypothetical protein